MAKFIITPKPTLGGEIAVLGAKNAAIKMIAASILIDGKTSLENVPDILDIQKIINILEKMGGKFRRLGHELEVDITTLRPDDPDPTLVAQIRASIVLVGPMLARFGRVRIPHPGGCTIGSRPIDLHLKAFQTLGVEVKVNGPNYEFFYHDENASSVVSVDFEKISVTATENVLLFASGLQREIIINNAAIEPEVLDLIEFLKKAGVDISQDGRQIRIIGRKNLKTVRHRVVPDRIEAGTLAIMAAATKSSLKILNCNPDHLKSLLKKFQEMGIKFATGENFLYINDSPGGSRIKAASISTTEYPGFPTDLQPPMGVLFTQAAGKSMIEENIFEHRLEYLKELQKMGAKIKILTAKKAEITGPTVLSGAKIESLDLRAGATLLIAALVANTKTEINHAENIDRGYEKIETRLEKIGAKIQRVR